MIFFKNKKNSILNKQLEEFEVFSRHKNLHYFDSACVTLKPKCVVDKIVEYYTLYPVCSGRSSHFLADKVSSEINKSRTIIKKYFGAKSVNEIIFTRNTTESINLLSSSVLKLLDKKNVLITDKEHNSNYLPWIKKEEEKKLNLFFYDYKAVNFDLVQFEKLIIEKKIDLVSLHYGSNVDGITLPLKEVIEISHKHNCLIIVDAAQGAAHNRINVQKLDIDFLVCSGHKLYGPSGIGILYGKQNLLDKMDTFLMGGDTVSNVNAKSYDLLPTPNKFEAGLQNYSGMIAMGEAIQFLDKNMEEIKKVSRKCLEIFFEEFEGLDVEILSSLENNCGIFTFIPKNINAKELGILLGEMGICVRTGNFCVHNWFNKYDKEFAVRFSLSIVNTEEEVREICKIVKNYL